VNLIIYAKVARNAVKSEYLRNVLRIIRNWQSSTISKITDKKNYFDLTRGYPYLFIYIKAKGGRNGERSKRKAMFTSAGLFAIIIRMFF